MNAWSELTHRENTEVWDRFDLTFAFRPSTKPEDWPGIREPRPAATYGIGHLWQAADRGPLEADLHQAALVAFRRCVGADDALYALDWQHTGYRFWPHRQSESAEWLMPLFPDGDYYVFLAPDFRFGWFGHPWEQTICVFGASLLAVLTEQPPRLFGQPLRRAT